MADKIENTYSSVLDEAKKKIAGVAEEVFAAMMAEELSKLAANTSANLKGEEVATADVAVDEAVEEAVETVAEEVVEDAEEIIEEAVVEEIEESEEPADEEPILFLDEDGEPRVIHFEDEYDEFDENGERIPYVPYNR